MEDDLDVEYEEFTFYNTQVLVADSHLTYHLNYDQPYTAFKVTTQNPETRLIISTKGEDYNLGLQSTGDDKESPPGFVITERPFTYLDIKASKSESIAIELFYAPEIDEIKPVNLKAKKNNCSEPQAISYNTWRSGLPGPKQGRSSTVVQHCIIHHSAGSNTDTNYTNIIRNIYLYHTQSNGWDDIGYNYVIAQNGDVYYGRDPQMTTSQDQVQGAHYCGKNSGTMGICLLGNYNNVCPRDTMLKSLYKLLGWKLYKEDLEANSSFPHPSSLDPLLGAIAMHKDGCATQCPGDSVELLMQDIKQEVQHVIDDCKGIVSVGKPTVTYKKIVYPNPSKGKFYALIEDEAAITRYTVINNFGQQITSELYPSNGLIKTTDVPGVYYLQLWSEKELVSTSKIIIQ